MFPKHAKELSFWSPIEVGIWKPPGDRPFPAVVLVHTCGGVREQMRFWRKEAVRRGYVAFIIDSFTSRGSPRCTPAIPTSFPRGVKDVHDAAAHLRTLPFVDGARIGHIGMSWGAMVGLLAASPGYAGPYTAGVRGPAAVVGLYPGCVGGPGFEFVRPDLATPTLVLLGGQDTETPAERCVRQLTAARARGAPVEWHVYPAATHCWDCRDAHGYRWSPPWAEGREVVYLYDDAITDDAADHAFEFLARRLPKK